MKVPKAHLLLALLVGVLSVSHSQTMNGSGQLDLYSHGTCATTITAPFGAAFIIDSRITQTDSTDRIVSQAEGCKVLLGRPTILLAGVGLEDTSSISGHWNSLDEAAKALKRLPEHFTEEQLDQWSEEWAKSLWNHFRQAGDVVIPPQKVSEILLLSNIGGQPYFRRTTVRWDGVQFHYSIAGQNIDKSRPNVFYAGACREFTNHISDDDGSVVVPAKYLNSAEAAQLKQVGQFLGSVTTVDGLAKAASNFENTLTSIDTRLEGDQAVIAPPYATAEWKENAKAWITHFNAKCVATKANASKSGKSPKSGTPKKKK